jgi:hypothetical protein
MSSCKDCVHYEVCQEEVEVHHDNPKDLEVDGIEEHCRFFKLKSRFVELPCEVGSKIYMLVTRKTHSFEWDENKRMLKVKNQHTFIKDTYFTKLNFWRVIDDFGKTVFLSRELAEEALNEQKKL